MREPLEFGIEICFLVVGRDAEVSVLSRDRDLGGGGGLESNVAYLARRPVDGTEDMKRIRRIMGVGSGCETLHAWSTSLWQGGMPKSGT